MVKMHDIRRTKADVAVEKKALGRKGGKGDPRGVDMYVAPEDDGARLDLEHHHIEKMGLNGDLKSGDTVHFTGHGTVEKSETRSSPEGDRHSATLRFQRAGTDHTPGDEAAGKKGLRDDLETAHSKSAESSGAKVAEKAGK